MENMVGGMRAKLGEHAVYTAGYVDQQCAVCAFTVHRSSHHKAHLYINWPHNANLQCRQITMAE